MFLVKSDTLAPDHGCEILVGMTVAQGVAWSSLHFLMVFFQNQLSSSINPFVYGRISCLPDIRHDISSGFRHFLVPFHSRLPGLISMFWISKSSQMT